MAELPMLPPLTTILALLRGGVASQHGVAEDFSSTHAAALHWLAEADRRAVYVLAGHHTRGLHYHYKAYRALSVPLWRLHRELLVEIFRLCLRFPEGGWNRQKLVNYDRRRSDQLFDDYRRLSRVCTYWRHVIRTSPQIWSCVPLDGSVEYINYESTSMYSSRDRKLNGMFLELSGQAPLEVYFTSVSQESLEAVASTMPRWKSAHMGRLNIGRLEEFASIATGRLSSLERLRLPCYPHPFPPTALQFLASATSLRFLSVSGHLLPIIPTTVLDSLAILVYTANRTTVAAAVRFMPSIPQSVDFKLEYYCTLPGDALLMDLDTLPPVECAIRRFTCGVGNYDASEAMGVFQHIFSIMRLPNLSELSLISTTSQSHITVRHGKTWTESHHPLAFPWPHHALLGMAVRSHSRNTLRVLDVRDTHVALEELLELVSGLDVLERLCISDHPVRPYPVHVVTNQLFSALTNTTLLPRLSQVFLHSMLRFNDATFLTFLASRQHAQPPPLKLAPFECHIRALPGYWREFGSRSRAEAALLPQWAALRTDARMRLSWSCEQPRPRIGDLEDLKAVPSAVHCVPDRYYSKHLRWTSDREPLKALDMEDRRLLGIW